jgi:hypothetical protein
MCQYSEEEKMTLKVLSRSIKVALYHVCTPALKISKTLPSDLAEKDEAHPMREGIRRFGLIFGWVRCAQPSPASRIGRIARGMCLL